jgi:8-oxo-dGTP pyrophosphatase MutT (NUDIX family)
MVKGVCAIECADRFLLIKRSVGNLGPALIFPGGKVEIGDGHRDILENTVRREVSEEFGFHIDVALHYLCSNLYMDIHGNHIIDTTFYCRLGELPPIVANVKEVPEYFWLSQDEIKASGCSGLVEWKIAKIQVLKAQLPGYF